MKSLINYITEKMVYNKSTASKYKYHPKTKEQLKELLSKLIKERGNNGDFNDIDTSEITDMSGLFKYMEDFNGDISNWNVSNVKNMLAMFYACTSFNQPLDNWDVSKVENMRLTFCECKSFNQPLNDWNVSNVKTMEMRRW